jgi:membrane protease YdiL (CAAX protease family)
MSSKQSGSLRDLVEVIFGFVLIVGILWVPEHPQRILAPIALFVTLGIVLARRQSADELGVGWHGLIPSLWILPAAILLAAVSMLAAHLIGTLHPLYKGDFAHVTGYIVWTTYQQFLLQDYFMPRLVRLTNQTAAVALVAVLFAVAHLPNLTLTAATLVWGAVSCLLFLRYRNIYAIGLAQGLLGLCFAICIPDALHHHLRVGLGYLRYHANQ